MLQFATKTTDGQGFSVPPPRWSLDIAISSMGSSCNDTDALGALQCVQVLRGALGSNHTSGLADRWRHHLRLKEEAAEVSQLLEEQWEICLRYRGLVVSEHVVTTPATQAGPDFLDQGSQRPCTSQRHGRMRCHHQIWKQHAKILFRRGPYLL